MDRRDSYLFKAAELLELAKNEHYSEFKAEFESLALAYLRLAEQANLRLAEQAKQKDYLDIASETLLLKQDGDPQPKHEILPRPRPVEMSQRCLLPRPSRDSPRTLPTGGCVWREIDELSANEQVPHSSRHYALVPMRWGPSFLVGKDRSPFDLQRPRGNRSEKPMFRECD